MNIERDALKKLTQWKENINRKPLILQGARQVGKTWLLKEFGKRAFDHVAYFNFDTQPALKEFFTNTKEPHQIIKLLSFLNQQPIKPNETLIVFDEIQECYEALNSLKYFCEDAPEYFVACAGSLLGVAMNKGATFPVGKVDFLTIHPLSFNEYLSVSDNNLLAYLESVNSVEAIPEIFFDSLVKRLKEYFITGGMPEAIVSIAEQSDVSLTQTVLQNILNSYTLDFSKHVASKDIQKIHYIWSSLPSQLSRENKKFLFQTVKNGARAREYEDALQWLISAGLVYKIYRSAKPSLPISAYDDLSAFKIYSLDVGILRRLSQLDPVAISEGNRLFTEFKGALTENFVLNCLLRQFETTPRYWASGNRAELDFLVQYQNEVLPVEVKSDENIRSKSMAFYRKEYAPEISLRYSLRNLKYDNGVLNIPLFMADFTTKLLGIL
ncbi:MAG TPA: AAA family ATPase [Bacteroidales bacterium]|nr:AAA family ATPase [Bacteroidales bacterium]HQI70703.1 AAA family ATPase [Bacteroidales bacterium]